jgi:hypothetical protein
MTQRLGGSLVELVEVLVNMPKAWKFFEVTHSTWSTLDSLLGNV